MFQLSPELSLWLTYAAPPIIGAFIGYLTNRVAIRMLFRPLLAWKILGIRVPMTPGVIPSKRVQLAENMGEVVGDYLLTSEEVGKALQQEALRKRLSHLIHTRVQRFLCRDLGQLISLVPEKFQIYFNLGVVGITWQVKSQIKQFIQSSHFEDILNQAVEQRVSQLTLLEVETLLSSEFREEVYLFLEKSLEKMFQADILEEWIDDFLHQKFYATLREKKTLEEVLPESFPLLLSHFLDIQLPVILKQSEVLLHDQEVQDRVVLGICQGVDVFIDSLGSASEMIRGFLDMEVVEQKIHHYFGDKIEDIAAWLQSDEMQEKIGTILRGRFQELMQKPVSEIVNADNKEMFEEFFLFFRTQIVHLIRDGGVAKILVSMSRTTIENEIESGSLPMGEVVSKLFGHAAQSKGERWIKAELHALLQSDEAGQAIDTMVESFFASLLEKRIGRLDRIVPVGVVDGVAHSLQKMVSSVLASEVPGLVHLLGIREIVTEKINSLDLLRLERLLLSIMEEQFKYINFFGAILGFLIGCLNLVFLLGQ